jgi:hypothetical protein
MSLPGLPALPLTVNVFDQATLMVADGFISSFGAEQWGLYLNGVPIIIADNVVSLEYRQDWRLSTYPQEQGAFATYNKVATPFEAKLRFSTGGSKSDRQNFIDSIAAVAGDTNLYDVVTPEAVYPSCNIVHYDYKRAAESAGLIAVDVWVEQVVIAGAATFSNTKNPSNAAQTQNGLVQGQNAGGTQNLPDPATIQ